MNRISPSLMSNSPAQPEAECSYVDTDIGKVEAARLQPNFSKGDDGRGSIADAAVVASVTASF